MGVPLGTRAFAYQIGTGTTYAFPALTPTPGHDRLAAGTLLVNNTRQVGTGTGPSLPLGAPSAAPASSAAPVAIGTTAARGRS